MELIYYWINKKKCIHEQGFCFSPEYNISMLKVEQGKYELKISRKKENNVFLSDVISNITVLVGDNGAGKTTLLKELWSLRCYPCENEDREEYQEFNKNENEKNKNLIILKKDDGQLYLYTNIYQKNIQIQGEIIKSIFYLSDYSSIASEFIRTSGEYFGFTKIYISNSYFDDLNGMSTNGKLDELAITPARLFFISSAFFEFICPDKTYNEKVNDFGRYSNWLKQNKDPDEFQQICDLMFYNFLIDEDFISDYEGFVQTQIRVNIYLAFTRIERAKMDGKIQESLWDIVKPVLDILHSKCIVDKAKDDLGYVLKTNFIFEWVLENGLEMLSTDDDIEAIYTKIVSVLGTKDISAANNLYFCDAANEIKEFTELLENIPSLKNDVPKKDLAYKSGRETEKYSRENILEASKWKEIIQYIADRVKISEEIFLGKRQYGSFLLRYAFKHISSIKQNNYIVSILFQNMPKEAKLLIYEQVGQNVCLYCNRNFIEDLKIVKNRNGRKPVGTFELDHFYSKDEFPMFAVSFYNLIPVCGTCNRIKSNTVFNINPYLMYDKKDNISFEYNILGSNYMENEDELEIRIKSSSKEALEDAQNLRLEEIYNRHKDIVQEIIKKMKYYNSEYIECLFKDTGALFQSKDELYRLLYGGYANPDEFGKRPLSKFIKDIYQNTKEVLDGFDIFSDIDT